MGSRPQEEIITSFVNVVHKKRIAFGESTVGFVVVVGFCFGLVFPEENRSLMGSHFEIGGKEENSMLML